MRGRLISSGPDRHSPVHTDSSHCRTVHLNLNSQDTERPGLQENCEEPLSPQESLLQIRTSVWVLGKAKKSTLSRSSETCDVE